MATVLDAIALARGEALSVMYITNLTYFLPIGPGKVKCDALADKSIAFARCLD